MTFEAFILTRHRVSFTGLSAPGLPELVKWRRWFYGVCRIARDVRASELVKKTAFFFFSLIISSIRPLLCSYMFCCLSTTPVYLCAC